MSQLDDKIMTATREVYLAHLKQWTEDFIDSRFRKGQRIHGGDLDRKACFPNLREELIDAIVYYYEHQRRLIKWASLLRCGLKGETSKEFAMDRVLQEIQLELSFATTEEVFED